MNYLYEEECFKLKKLINKKALELNYMANVIENIPYRQIAPTHYIEKQKNLYQLNYYVSWGFFSTKTSKYLFSKDILNKIKDSMFKINVRIRSKIKKEILKEMNLLYVSDNELDEFLSCIGYISLKEREVSYNIKNEVTKKSISKINCNFCGDGGCIHCESYRFI